jgi:hypothetical protein
MFPIIRVKRISELGTLEVAFHPDDGDMFLRNIGSYKSHTASQPRSRQSSGILAFGRAKLFRVLESATTRTAYFHSIMR